MSSLDIVDLMTRSACELRTSSDTMRILLDTEDLPLDSYGIELHMLADGLMDLTQQWEEKRAVTDAAQSARIIKTMIKDWKLAGTVFYHPQKKRFRLCDEGYKKEEQEICVGVYTKACTLKGLTEDFAFVMDNVK